MVAYPYSPSSHEAGITSLKPDWVIKIVRSCLKCARSYSAIKGTYISYPLHTKAQGSPQKRGGTVRARGQVEHGECVLFCT